MAHNFLLVLNALAVPLSAYRHRYTPFLYMSIKINQRHLSHPSTDWTKATFKNTVKHEEMPAIEIKSAGIAD
jgi:hypothetical protein